MMRTEGRGVRDDGHDRPSADREMRVRSAIGGWRDSVIKAADASQLLDLGPGMTPVVRLVRPSAEDVLSRLRSGGTYTFRSPPPAPAWPRPGAEPPWPADDDGEPAPGIASPAADVLDTDAGPDDLATTLRTLMRRSNQEYLDSGLWVLHLAFGALTWTDKDRARYTSPVLLVPVRLVATGPRQLPALEPAEDDPVVNPALVRELSQNGITLPPMDEAEDVTLDGLLDTVRAAVAGRDGWQVSDAAVLSCFSFAREAIYRDLVDHEDLAAAHPAVRALVAGGPGAASGFVFDAIAEDEVDTRAAPESIPVILDADASQRAAIAAALDGRSFVLEGPPGTGKSQTIANMIGALLHAGKTVLFVSEKAAALDVVRDRLAGAGLDAYLLALHSSQAVRKQVAVSLGKALDTVPVAPAPMPPADVDTARRRREQLSAYAEAMNRPRDPLGYSLHDILGVIATLRAVPAAPTTGRAPVADLTVEMFGNIRETATTLAGAWRPAAQGRSFVWRDVIERGPLDAPLYQAASALEALTGITRLNQTLAEVTGLTRPSDAGALARLLDHLLTWPPGVPDEWLTTGTLDPVDAAVARLSTAFSEIAASEDKATRAAGTTWSAIPRSGMLPALDDADLARLTPACADAEGLGVEQITGLAMAFTAEAEMLEGRQGTLASLADILGLRAPATFGEAADLLLIAHLAEEPDRPERGWLPAKPGVPSTTPITRSPGQRPTPARTTPPRRSTPMCGAWPTGSMANITAWANCPRSTGRTRRPSPASPGRGSPGKPRTSSWGSPSPGGAPRRRSRPPRPLARRCSAGTTRAAPPTSIGSATRSTAPPAPLSGPTGRISGGRPATLPPMPGRTRRSPAWRPRRARTWPPGRQPSQRRPPAPPARSCWTARSPTLSGGCGLTWRRSMRPPRSPTRSARSWASSSPSARPGAW